MEFRPCIDIHNGAVKQIVGSSLRDAGDTAVANFVSDHDAAYYAKKYREDGFAGGHVIMLNARDSSCFAETEKQALAALSAFPGGLQIGGGITDENAGRYLDAGASHVITTSFVFRQGRIDRDALRRISSAVGKAHLVLDLSCKKKGDRYFVMTDRWQTFTEEAVTETLLTELAGFCDEFLVHAVDVEGKASGMETELIRLLARWDGIPVTYAGGITSLPDLDALEQMGSSRIHATIGSALDLFGGTLSYEKVKEYFKK
ncbi:MAG: phosphoribosylformimino-5-aminoimidazole carboxamide ribotide isomerase [Lachnospiraceae bacterium]|nr:phosphoribosylformimino-5-aminoimidazole carboxamide ribotide isomerase [Lachnospiraceae bacterium]